MSCHLNGFSAQKVKLDKMQGYQATDGDVGVPFKIEDRKVSDADIVIFQFTVDDLKDAFTTIMAPVPGIVPLLVAYGVQYAILAAVGVTFFLLMAISSVLYFALSGIPSLLLLWRVLAVIVAMVAGIAGGAGFMIVNGTTHLSLVRSIRGERVPLGKDWLIPPVEYIPHFLYYQTVLFVICLPFIILFPLMIVVPFIMTFFQGTFMYMMVAQTQSGLIETMKLTILGAVRNWLPLLILGGINLAAAAVCFTVPVVYIIVAPYCAVLGLIYTSKMFSIHQAGDNGAQV